MNFQTPYFLRLLVRCSITLPPHWLMPLFRKQTGVMMTEINIEIVYATAEHQHLWQSRVPAGTCVRQALLQSDLPQRFPLT
ncbi:MAG: RnfH family protein, partial [Snodgrassella sp.]|nr:RnfH family protein [Snodgrassella sp.]